MKIFGVFISLLIVVYPTYAEEVMKFAYEETGRPYSWKENGQMKGILIDIVNAVIHERMGIQVSHNGYPWKRAQSFVKTGEMDAHITNSPFRSEWADHSSEVAIYLEHLLYVGAKNANLSQIRKAISLEELRPFRFVDNRGSGWAQKNLVEKGFDVFLATEHGTIYKMLAFNRADVSVSMSHVARYHIKQLGFKDRIVELDGVSELLPFHLVVGKLSPFTRVIPQFDEAIREFKREGGLELILDKYN